MPAAGHGSAPPVEQVASEIVQVEINRLSSGHTARCGCSCCARWILPCCLLGVVNTCALRCARNVSCRRCLVLADSATTVHAHIDNLMAACSHMHPHVTR